MKFSIITCTYNSEKYVKNNIDSVKNQSLDDFEHIFIDGFSQDGTVEIIKKYQKNFPNKVKFFQFEPKGIANAMNAGIEISSGEFIIHLHSDDSFFNNTVLQVVSNYVDNNPNIDWFYGKANFINTENFTSRIIPHRNIYKKVHYWLLLLTNYIPHQSVFLRKKVFTKFGNFDEKLKNLMDYDLWIRLSQNKVSAKFMDTIICNFSVRKDSQSTTGKYNNENLLIYKKYLKCGLLIKLLYIIDKINKRRTLV